MLPVYSSTNRKCAQQKKPICVSDCPPRADPIVINFYVISLVPSSGPVTGNNNAIVIGSGLSYADGIDFGGISITNFMRINDNQISFTVPPMSSTATVQVFLIGKKFISNALCYKYILPMTITSIVPNEGPSSGNTTVTILGSNLSSAQNIQFGSSIISSFQIIDDNTISFVALPGSGTINVSVTSYGGNSNVLTYSYIMPPII